MVPICNLILRFYNWSNYFGLDIKNGSLYFQYDQCCKQTELKYYLGNNNIETDFSVNHDKQLQAS